LDLFVRKQPNELSIFHYFIEPLKGVILRQFQKSPFFVTASSSLLLFSSFLNKGILRHSHMLKFMDETI